MSKKLPKIQFVARPAWQKQRLGEWLQEWNLGLSLRGQSPSETPSGAPSIPFLGATVGLIGFHGLVAPRLAAELALALASNTRAKPNDDGPDAEASSKLVRPFDRPIAVGQVRLLSPELTPDTDRPVFVAVFGDWDEGEVLMAPFSPFSVPATAGEWLTGRTTPVLRVLEIWNARSVPDAALEKSWLVDDFADAECKTAWHIFEHEALGKALAVDLEQQVGPPLVHPDDPRRQYLDEEFARLAKFQSIAEGIHDNTIEKQQNFDVRARQDTLGDESEELLALAASSKEPLPDIQPADDLIAGFQGHAKGDGRDPSETSILRLAFTGSEAPRPLDVPAGGIVIKWPTGQSGPHGFTFRSGRWRTEIQLPLPWPEMVKLLREKKLRVEPVPLT